jgi:hypothetical protein
MMQKTRKNRVKVLVNKVTVSLALAKFHNVPLTNAGL